MWFKFVRYLLIPIFFPFIEGFIQIYAYVIFLGLNLKVVFNITMSKINTHRRVTRDLHYSDNYFEGIPSFDLHIAQLQPQISGSNATMEIEKQSKIQNKPIMLNLNDNTERLVLLKGKKVQSWLNKI